MHQILYEVFRNNPASRPEARTFREKVRVSLDDRRAVNQPARPELCEFREAVCVPGKKLGIRIPLRRAGRRRIGIERCRESALLLKHPHGACGRRPLGGRPLERPPHIEGQFERAPLPCRGPSSRAVRPGRTPSGAIRPTLASGVGRFAPPQNARVGRFAPPRAPDWSDSHHPVWRVSEEICDRRVRDGVGAGRGGWEGFAR
jgi:hypothetical protein